MKNQFLKSDRNIFCWNTIDFAFSERIISKLLEYVKEPDKNNIVTLLINSNGGNTQDAFAIVDIILNLKIPIRTVGLGGVHSASTYILIAGNKGNRFATKHTEFLVHPYRWDAANAHYDDLVCRRKYEDFIQSRLVNFYKKHTTLSNSDIRKFLLGNDHYFGAETALKYGFVDKII